VLIVSSCLMYSGNPVRGVFAERAESSEGKVDETGVCSCASLGLVVEPMVTPDRMRAGEVHEGKGGQACDDK
jgi:hypothetical protein